MNSVADKITWTKFTKFTKYYFYFYFHYFHFILSGGIRVRPTRMSGNNAGCWNHSRNHSICESMLGSRGNFSSREMTTIRAGQIPILRSEGIGLAHTSTISRFKCRGLTTNIQEVVLPVQNDGCLLI